MPKAEQVQNVFRSVARRYDLANRAISLGRDESWRRDVVHMAVARKPRVVLDLATGSGDLAFALRKAMPEEVTVSGLDFCEPMLEQARAKQARRPWAASIRFYQGDCMALPLPDSSVDVLTIAWGLRNLEDRGAGLAQMHRVLRPGGVLYCLEASQPHRLVRRPYYLYLDHVVPMIARLITGQRGAYEYLANTIGSFPDRELLSDEMRLAGFGSVTTHPRMFGGICIHEAVKAGPRPAQ